MRWRFSSELQHRDWARPTFHPDIFLLIYFAVFTDDRWAGGHVVVVTFGKIRDVFGENICNAVYRGYPRVRRGRGVGAGHARGRGESPGRTRMRVEGGGGSGGRVRGHALADVGRGVRPSAAGHHRRARHVVKVLKQSNITKQRRSVELYVLRAERELQES